MNRLPHIHHVQIAMPAGGEADARAFYSGMLGFVEIARPRNLADRPGVWFRTGNLDLHVGVEQDFAPAKKAHIAYVVDDLPAIRQALEAAGFSITLDVPLPGFDRIHTTDVFGNRLELISPTE